MARYCANKNITGRVKRTVRTKGPYLRANASVIIRRYYNILAALYLRVYAHTRIMRDGCGRYNIARVSYFIRPRVYNPCAYVRVYTLYIYMSNPRAE